MINGEHLTVEGFNKILSIRASLNLGLSDKLKAEFPTIVAMERPVSSLPLDLEIKEYNPYWLVGFSEGDGSFFVGLTKSALYKAGYQVSLRFLISQHNRDISLMVNIAKYLNCGTVVVRKGRNQDVEFRVNSFSDIESIIVPFFTNYTLQGTKKLDFYDFLKVVDAVKNKKHLTLEGIEYIKQVKNGMNSSREV
uniref:LAGLIDADG endonuclease n=1 Tax=Elmerina hispida TaxID=1245649 RepID=UPI003001D5A4|nr:LAGLIDADG endonuclease [Elmerina hispida]